MPLATATLIATPSALRVTWPAPTSTANLAGYDVVYYRTSAPAAVVRHDTMIPVRSAWIKDLTPATAYTVIVRTVSDAGARVDHASGAATTGAASVGAYDKTAQLQNSARGVYDLNSLTGSGTISRDAVAASLFAAGDVVSRRVVVGKVGKDVEAKMAPLNATATAPKKSGAIFFPFDPSGAGTQTANVLLNSGSQVSVTYATSAPTQLTVAGVARPVKTSFVLDGRRAYVASA